MVSLPVINLNKVAAAGEMTRTSLTIERFDFGDANAPLEGALKGEVKLDARLMPTGGELKGHLRTNPTFERAYLQIIGMDNAFGKVGKNGRREFTKKVKPNFMWILEPPIDK